MTELKTAEAWPVRDASPYPHGAARGAATPEPAPLPLSTSQTSLPAATSSQVLWLMWAGAEAAKEAAGGVSPPPPRADRGAAMLRATPAGRRSLDRPELVLRCSGRLATPRQGPGQLCSRWAASGKLRGALRRRFATVTKTRHITIVTIAVYLSAIRLCTYIYTLSVRVSPSGNPMEL